MSKSRKKPSEQQPESVAKTGGKGRPTPKRREAQKAHERGLVPDKKVAKQLARERRQEAYRRQDAALAGTGDERYLPSNDQGKHRKYIRNFIDSRWTISEFVLPAMLLAIVLQFVMLQFVKSLPLQMQQIPVYIVYGFLILCVVECVYLTRKVNRILENKFPEIQDVRRGTGRYVLFRITSPRPFRRPRPQVARGEAID